MFNPQIPGTHFVLAIGKARQSELLREEEQHRLIRRVKATKPMLLDRVLTGIGGLLVSVGTKLQELTFYRNNYQTAR